MSGPGVRFSSSPATTNSGRSWMPVMRVVLVSGLGAAPWRLGSSLRLRPRMPGHQRVRMNPTGLVTKARDPVADMRVLIPVDADFLGPEHVTAQRQIGDRQPIGNDVAPRMEVGIEDAPRRFCPRAEFGEHGMMR